MREAATGERLLSRDEADQAVVRLRQQEDDITAALLELEQHPGYRMLSGADLAGVTLERWNAAKAVIATLWDGLAAHKAAVDSAATILARHGHPDQARLAELTRLLTGRSVTLTGPEVPLEQRGLLGPRQQTEQLTLAELVTRMNASFTQVTEVVATAGTTWSDQVSRLTAAESAWREAGETARSLGLPPGSDPLSDTVARLGGELARARAAVLRDPLSRWRGGRTDTGQLDQIRDQLAEVASQLQEAARAPAEFDTAVRQMTALIEAAQTAEADGRAAQQQARAKIAGPAAPVPQPSAPSLRSRLAGLNGLRDSGRWPALAAALADLRRDAQAAADRARAALAQAMAPVAERDELRGRLRAYQAKAARTGHGEDLGLAAIYRKAAELLWTAPCQLDQARDAVRRYQDAVTRQAERGR